MRVERFLFILGLLFAPVACQKAGPTNQSQKAESASESPYADQVRKVSFTLSTQKRVGDTNEPFARAEIAIFHLEGDKIRVSDNDRLGLGKTDANGRATIEFRSPAKYSSYVLLWSTKKGPMTIRHEGKALTFQCDPSKPACDLGHLVFETAVFSTP